jgi:hypothetical protein
VVSLEHVHEDEISALLRGPEAAAAKTLVAVQGVQNLANRNANRTVWRPRAFKEVKTSIARSHGPTAKKRDRGETATMLRKSSVSPVHGRSRCPASTFRQGIR